MTSAAATRPARARRPLIASLLIAPALVMAGCGGGADGATSARAGGPSGQSEQGGSSTTITGEGVPDFTAATVDDGTLDATTLEGGPTVLWFWTPWCPTCEAEAPGVADVAEELEGKVDVVGVAGLGERPAVLLLLAGAYVACYGWSELRVLAGGSTADPVVGAAITVHPVS